MIPVSQDGSSGAARFVVGSYSESYGSFRARGDGLTLIALDSCGRLSHLDCLHLPNPSFARPIGHDRVAVVLETNDERAAIVLVEIGAESLKLVQEIRAPGRIPCHLDLHPSGRWLAGACYGTGEVFALPVASNNELVVDAMLVTRHEGRSVHPVRQTGPHPHAARFSPDGCWLVVPDLGADLVVSYGFDEAAGPDFSTKTEWKAPPGSGPRLPLFSADGRHLVLVEEIASALVGLTWKHGKLGEIGRISSLIKPFAKENTAAGLRWHPSGRIIGTSNRGADTIALFHFDSASGGLRPWAEIPCGGTKPRDFAFSPCGRWLISSSQDSDLLALFALDLDRGEVCDTEERLMVRSPSCVCALAA